MNIISIDSHNIYDEYICCAIGNDKENQNRTLTKKNWINEQFGYGLIFKKLNVRGKVFIEYIPIETV